MATTDSERARHIALDAINAEQKGFGRPHQYVLDLAEEVLRLQARLEESDHEAIVLRERIRNASRVLDFSGIIRQWVEDSLEPTSPLPQMKGGA